MPEYWRTCFRVPDTRKVWQWGEDELRLKNSPFGKKFNSALTPWLREPMEAFQTNVTNEMTCQCCVQGGKTIALQVMAAWAVLHQPAPMMINCQTDDDAKDFAKERMNPMLEQCPAIRHKLPKDRINKALCQVSLPDMFLIMQGANLSNLQSKSIRWLFNDELWLWKQGFLQQARNRTTMFWNRRICNFSTAGEEDSDLDNAFKDGDQREWHLRCPSCKKLSHPKWERIEYETSDYTRPEGVWNYQKLKERTWYTCEHCKVRHTHTERVHKQMNEGGGYIALNANPKPGSVSFHWNALCLSPSTVSWGDLAVEWVKATTAYDNGVVQPRKEFVQMRLAESWNEFKYRKVITLPTHTNVKRKWKDELFRFITVDVQEREFWVVVRAWGQCESRLLWAGKVLMWEEIEDKQKEYKVPNACVFVDSSYDTRKVYEMASVHNDLVKVTKGKVDWVGWKCLNGEAQARKNFKYTPKGGRPRLLPYSFPHIYVNGSMGRSSPGGKERFAKLHYWANDTIKDILVRLRDGRAKGTKWLAYDGVGKDWTNHMFGERRLEVVDKYGQTRYKWERIGRRRCDLWDCEAMQLVGAAMAGLLGEQFEAKN